MASRGMRDEISEAIDAREAGEDFEETRQEILTDEPDEEREGETAETAEGEPSAESEGAEAEGDAISAESDPDAKAPSDPKAEKDTTSNQSLKAPAGWKPAEREQWSKVPRPLQERILAREKEMAEGMANTKDARAVNEYVEKMGSHYGDMIKSAGFNHPLEAAGSAMNSMNVLAQGSQEQKATELARIINQFNVDIETLDNALSGSGGEGSNGGEPSDPTMARLEKMLEERLAPVNQLMSQAEQMRRQQEQEQSTQASQAVQKFADQAEFLPDVRQDMADIIELAAKRGQQLTLQQAYDRACAAHPEISEIMAQRRREEEIKGGRSTINAKRTAASSISGRQSGSGAREVGNDIRSSIAAAMDEREV